MFNNWLIEYWLESMNGTNQVHTTKHHDRDWVSYEIVLPRLDGTEQLYVQQCLLYNLVGGRYEF